VLMRLISFICPWPLQR